MTQPTAYDPSSDFEADLGTAHGAHLNTEFQNIKQTLSEVLANLALIQRDDTKISNSSVHPDAFTSAAKALIAADWTPKGLWSGGTSYVIGDVVEQSGNSYVCATAHVSGTFATDHSAGKWVVIYEPLSSAGITAGLVAFTPTGAITSSDVQAALAEVSNASLRKSLNLSDIPSASAALANLNGMSKTGGAFSGVVDEAKATNVAAAATVDLSLVTGNRVTITGSGTISSFGTVQAGALRRLEFDGICTLQYNATSLITPGNANLVTAAGDVCYIGSLGSGNWKVENFQRQASLNPLTEYSSLGTTITPILTGSNRVTNPLMRINQRGATSVADDAYCLDRWYVLCDTGSATVAQQTDQESGTPFNIRLTQPDASAKRIGLAQIIESSTVRDLRGSSCTLSARIRCSIAQTIRYAILEHTGTADTVTSDVVNNWSSSTYTASNFFAAGFNVVAIGSVAPLAATWTDINQINGSCGGTMNNLVIFFWTEGTLAQNGTLDISRVQLEKGAIATPFEYIGSALDLRNCQRFYEKSFPQATAPAQNVGSSSAVRLAQCVGASTAQNGNNIRFSVTKRGTPTITFYNPAAANAQARNVTTNADCASTAVGGGATDQGFDFGFTSAAATAAGNAVAVHWTADAEL